MGAGGGGGASFVTSLKGAEGPLALVERHLQEGCK